MSITRNFNLYLNAGHSIPLVINASQYDQGEIWNFTIYNSDGTQYTPTDASIVGKKSDGNLIAIAATVSDGIVSVTETEQMTAAAGKNVFELQIDSLTHGTANFVVLVEADPTQDGVVSESALSLIDQAINGGISTTVRQAIYNLFNAAAYADADVSTDLTTVQSWAATVTAISLNQSAITISGSNTYQLVATTTPSGGAVTWASSDTSIATVSASGLVTGVNNGTVTITASCGDLSATCTATVSGFATLSSISAVYSGSSVEEGTALDDLKSDLVVTATYDDSSTATIASSDYTLSGTLAEGTCTITVSYGGCTDTFTVTVTAAALTTSGYITVANETLTDGYINDSGEVASHTGSYFIDTFYDALPFSLGASDDFLAGTLRGAYYDENHDFMSRNYVSASIKPIATDSVYQKVGWTSLSPDYVFLLNSIDSALFTNTDMQIDASGALASSSGQSATDMISIPTGCDKFVIYLNGSIVRIAFYDSDQTFISRYYNSANAADVTKYGDIPANAVYFRMDKKTSATEYYPLMKGI